MHFASSERFRRPGKTLGGQKLLIVDHEIGPQLQFFPKLPRVIHVGSELEVSMVFCSTLV